MENKKIDIDITKTDTGYMVDFNGIVIAGSYSPRNCVLKRYRTDTEKLNLQLQALNLEIINKEKTPTEEEIIKEWEALGYEIQYWNKNVGIQLEKTIYKDNSAYAWHTIYIDVKTKEYYKHNIHLTYISFTFQEHQLLTKTFKMLGWEV